MLTIRSISLSDREDYIRMATEFYASDAVLFHVDQMHFYKAFDELMRSHEYMLCHIFEYEGKTAGYGLVSKTYSQEAGGLVYWIEEVYVRPAFRCRGIGKAYFSYLLKTRPNDVKRFRLETEPENEGAVRLYKSIGFSEMGYNQMLIDF